MRRQFRSYIRLSNEEKQDLSNAIDDAIPETDESVRKGFKDIYGDFIETKTIEVLDKVNPSWRYKEFVERLAVDLDEAYDIMKEKLRKDPNLGSCPIVIETESMTVLRLILEKVNLFLEDQCED